MSGSLFGVVSHLDPQIALIIFICLIISLIIIESVLHVIEHQAKIAGYEELVNRLYRELALMGCIGFCVLVVFTVFPLEHGESYLAFEFSHITTFFIAIFLCLRAIYVVYNAQVAAKGLWKAHNISAKILSELHESAMTSWNIEGILYRYVGVLSPLRRWVEYTIIEEYFYRHFCLSRTEFRFVDYLTRSYQMYAISLTEVSPYSWSIIIILAILNYIRILLLHSPKHVCHVESHSSAIHHGEHDDDGGHHSNTTEPTTHPSSHSEYSHSPTSSPGSHHILRYLSSGGDESTDDGNSLHLTHNCANYEMNYFLFCGFLLTLVIAIIAYVTWQSECKLLEMAMTRLTKDNYGKHSNYGKILKALAVLDAKKTLLVNQRSNVPLSSTAGESSGMLSSVKPEDVFEDDINDLLDESMVYHMVTLRLVLKDMKHEEEIEHIKDEFERNELIKRIYRSMFCLFNNQDIERDKLNRISELKEKEKKLESLENKFRSTSGRQSDGSMRGYSIKKLNKVEKREGLESIKHAFSTDSNDDNDWVHEHDLRKETNNVFPFHNRELYKLMIEISLMLFALYCSLWVSHFILIGAESTSPITYILIIISSILVIFILISYIQYHSNMILSVTSLCNETAEWMCNQDYIKSKTLPILRTEIKDMLNKLGSTEFEEAIKEIFLLVNMDGDDKILLDEFSTLLYTLDIHLTNAETRVLFRSMDMDGNGSISLEELRELLLDDSVLISKKVENANVKMIKYKSKSSLDQFQKLVAKEIQIDAIADALKQSNDDDDHNNNNNNNKAINGEEKSKSNRQNNNNNNNGDNNISSKLIQIIDLESGSNASSMKSLTPKKEIPKSSKIVPMENINDDININNNNSNNNKKKNNHQNHDEDENNGLQHH